MLLLILIIDTNYRHMVIWYGVEELQSLLDNISSERRIVDGLTNCVSSFN